VRFIDLAYVLPPSDFAANVEVAEADGEDNIGNHSNVWRGCKTILKTASNDKCYYCEIKEKRSDGVVDHYRPKSKYTWAAFRFDNFRFACTFCNSRRTDPKTGEVGGKGAGFPLLEGCKRASCFEEVCEEIPILLDPCNAADPGAIDFLTDGTPQPRSLEENDLQRLRAIVSIEAYHLHHSELIEARRRNAIEIQEKVGEAESALLRLQRRDFTALEPFNTACRDLKRRISPASELSAFSRRVLQSYKTKSFVDDILATA
jgi:uncharacterized protein (TIGR02646 family)